MQDSQASCFQTVIRPAVATFMPLLLTAFILLLSSCAQSASTGATVNKTPDPWPTLQHTPTVSLQTPSLPQLVSTPLPAPVLADATPHPHWTGLDSIHMLDSTSGWALQQPHDKYDDYPAVLHTGDGGFHWQRVTPTYAMQPAISPTIIADFLSTSTAWVAVRIDKAPAPTQQILLFRTSDGGSTWQGARITTPPNQLYDALQITAIDAQHAWIWFDRGENQSGAQAIDIVRTTDGGKSWYDIASAAPTANALPLQGEKSGLSFLDAATGWASGWNFGNQEKPDWLYVTHDGGSTWHPQSLALPPNLAHGWLLTIPPRFFNASDGMLPALYAGDANHEFLVCYVTRDGGTSWSATTPTPAFLSISSGIATVADAINAPDQNHIWALNTVDKIFYTTGDGGRYWKNIPIHLPYKLDAFNLSSMSFISNTSGWLAGASGNSDPFTPFLFKTTDSGSSWTKINYTIP